MPIFEKRTNYKPFEYPEVTSFRRAIKSAIWTVEEFGEFTADVQDYHVKLSPVEKEAVKRSLLTISQIEVKVKEFWADLKNRFPKPEIAEVGITFGENEVTHAESYSKLLEVLGFNDEFAQLFNNPVIQNRVEYLTKYLKGASDNSNENYALNLTLFSLFIENVSLFSQFLIVKSFNKNSNLMKDVDNVIMATAKEEVVHAEFGMWLLAKIKEENPEWFNETFYAKIHRACKKAYEAEEKIIDWILEAGDLPFLTREDVKNFTRNRFNESLVRIGGEKAFEVDEAGLKKLFWFDEEVTAESRVDFWYKRPTSYTRGVQSITRNDLF